MRPKKIYLSGAMFGCSEFEVRGWREEAKKLLGPANCSDPADRWHQYEAELSVAAGWEIINADLKDIETSTGMLVNAWRCGWGTAMELRCAYEMRKPVATVINGPVSAWLKCHSDFIANSVAEAAHWLATQCRLENTVWNR